jgi:hydrogenase maturation protein HypF
VNTLQTPPAALADGLAAARVRARVSIRGAVQGVGFRPFVYRLASEHRLSGWVNNSTQGVFIEVEGGAGEVQRFLLRLQSERPPRASIQSLETAWLEPAGYAGFEIRASDASAEKTALVLPDIATCAECLEEIFSPHNRRFYYPFTNCTNCGPRFSIIEALPYDRPNTAMKGFAMCEQCQAEYQNPRDRRFHAQPNACPACGPHVELWEGTGRRVSAHRAAILRAGRALRAGAIVAVKGLGGFHLLVAAGDEVAVRRLRERKHREEKPLALMFPSLASVREQCEVSDQEERLLQSPEAPIVLLRRRQGAAVAGSSAVAASVAPGNPYLGVMLPYTPLHHLLLASVGRPVVATSGNRADEPICTDEREALARLAGIADLFLVHNRPIVRHVDDSIVRIVLGRELVLRRARGFAPLPIRCPAPPRPTLAVGAHLKNTVALATGGEVFLSQHIGDLETAPALGAFRRVIGDLERLYAARPEVVAADAHPDYISSRQARATGLPVLAVQHHYAHVLACMAENEVEPPLLGVSWDGTGYGPDDTIWGGEFLRITSAGYERVGHLRTFRLPGGVKAVQEPRRAALGLLYEMFGEEALLMKDLPPIQAFSVSALRTLKRMLAANLNCPQTSSAGRLFDAVASIAGLRQESHFEGQAAMDLEFALEGDETDEVYPLRIAAGQPPAPTPPAPEPALLPRPSSPGLVVDWAPMLRELLHDLRAGIGVWEIAAKFHNALAKCIVAVAQRVGEQRVVLTGGCFQNKYLTERAVLGLRSEGFSVYWHQRVPPNDGGIAVGQIAAAARGHPR